MKTKKNKCLKKTIRSSINKYNSMYGVQKIMVVAIPIISAFVILSAVLLYLYKDRPVEKYQLELLKGHVWVWESTFKTTKYTLCPTECSKQKNHRYYGITRSGRKARAGVSVAVDPKIVPLGSLLIDERGHFYIAEDTGNMVKGYHVDIFVGPGTPANRKRALDWGVRNKWFMVIERGVSRD